MINDGKLLAIAEAVPGQEHVFLSAESVEMGDDQAMVISTEVFNIVTLAGMPPHQGLQSWRPCYLTEKFRCDFRTL
jgi:hypothetical protein